MNWGLREKGQQSDTVTEYNIMFDIILYYKGILHLILNNERQSMKKPVPRLQNSKFTENS